MKKKIVGWIKIKGMGYYEIVVPIHINDEVQFDSIEWVMDEDQIVLHKFMGELDYEINWEDLPNDWQRIIYHQLIPSLLN